MAYNHPAWIEHQRWRSMRHDWKRWVTPALAREMEATHPGVRKRAAQREREHQAALAEWQADQDEIARLRVAIADLKFALALRRICEEKYSPAQPRVPAGNPDGGQWTDDPGTGRNDPRVISDAMPDAVRPGARYAQDTTQRRYPLISRRKKHAAAIRSGSMSARATRSFSQACGRIAGPLAFFTPTYGVETVRSRRLSPPMTS